MGANVTVLGVNSGMGGLKESLTKFKKHHEEVGEALMNISGVGTANGEKVDKDEPRPPYQHQAFPKMVYHADGRELTVNDTVAHADAKKRGFRDEWYPKPQVQVLDPATEKKALLDERDQLRAQLATQGDLLAKLAARLETIEVGKK